MSLNLDLPLTLQEELYRKTADDAGSPEDRATLLLCLTTAIRKNGPETPFRTAVRDLLASRSLDPDQVATAFDDLVRVCAAHDLGKRNHEFEAFLAIRETERDQVLGSWKDPKVHETNGASNSGMVSRSRPSARGMAAHHGVTSEDVAREHQDDIAREEKGWN